MERDGSLRPPVLVETDDALRRLVRDLDGQREIALDTEADSLHSYREKVCLIQLTAGETDYLIDPLAGVDLELLRPLLAAETPLKVFHDAEYDLLILRRDVDLRVNGLFDTKVAASALGYPQVGLAALLKERFGVELDKRLQRSDWSARPLTRDQVEYARLDTHFLVVLMAQLRQELEARGRLHIVETEHRRLEGLAPEPACFDPEGYARIKGASSLTPAQARTLRELYILRERLAEERNVPPFKVLGALTLLDLAHKRPTDRRGLGRVRGLPRRLSAAVERRLLEVIRSSLEMPPIERSRRDRRRTGPVELSRQERNRLERLRIWRKRRAERERLDPSLLLNRQCMLRLAKSPPASLDELGRGGELAHWQLRDFGPELLRILREDGG